MQRRDVPGSQAAGPSRRPLFDAGFRRRYRPSIRANDSTALRQQPRRFSSARLRLVRALEVSARVLGGRRFYRWRHLASGRFLLREESLAIPGLPAGLEGLTCVQLSDLHAGPFLQAGDLSEVIEAANACEPHLVLITGDPITHEWRDALLILPELARLRAQLGVLAVFGNHDYRGRQEGRIAESYAEAGVTFLRNQSRRFEVQGCGVVVVGLEDLEEGKLVDLESARSGVRSGDVELVLCHNPQAADRLARSDCAAVFCGHTHGGQLDLPLMRGNGPAHPGTRVQLGRTRVLVNRGLGTIGLPVRIGVPTEILVARLRRADELR